ncbi:MAG: hypothetical protein DCC65_05425 [Planctomycetota bacterium]|nr:MAG: hypothetical protein DCC65_05425 [Planctomycetota bacterium]
MVAVTQFEPLVILLAHDRWATRQILDSCQGLTPEQFQRSFDIGPGSLHDAVTHILGAMQSWCDVLAGRERRPRLQGVTRNAAELGKLLERLADELATHARARPLDEMATWTREGKSYQLTRGGVLTHVTTHGGHHRAQCLYMLRQLGVDPLPPVSVLEWMLLVDGARLQ